MSDDTPNRGADQSTVKTVAKVLDILEHLGAAARPLTVSEVAEGTGINVSTAHRLLQTLTRRGYAEQHPVTRSYGLGPRLLELGSAYAGDHDLTGAALPRLEELRDKVGETIHLSIYSDGDNMELCTAAGPHVISVGQRAGHREPAHCTATGKVMLAFLPPAELDRFFQRGPLQTRTGRSIADKATLLAELEQIRRQGYATDDEEMAADLCCVGVPVGSPGERVVAALSIAAPKARFKAADLAGWVELLTETAARIAGTLALSNRR